MWLKIEMIIYGNLLISAFQSFIKTYFC